MKKILLLALVAILLAGGLVLMSCGEKCPGGRSSGGAGNCYVSYTTVYWCTKGVYDCMPGSTTRCQCN